jgi:lipopolysaccharide/colanic/teichoic acid biosynthesis glycosyltransferase
MVTKNQIDFIDHTATVTVKKRRAYWVIKRTQDIVLSSIALIVLLPIMILVALIIFIDDPHGSPIFTQERIGRKGKTFKMYKFRSMYVDAEARLEELLQYNEMDGPAFKIKDDPRITRVGKFIRATSIDELPQLWNVLAGGRCIIGATKKNLDFSRVVTA